MHTRTAGILRGVEGFHALADSARLAFAPAKRAASRLSFAKGEKARRHGLTAVGLHTELMIKKVDGKYVVLSEKTGRSFGTYRTLVEAKKRLRQIEMFKHLKRRK